MSHFAVSQYKELPQVSHVVKGTITGIHVVKGTIKQMITDLMSPSQFHSTSAYT